jgi:hypothetical protein
MSAIAEVYDPSCRHLDLWFDMSFIILVYSTGVHTEKVNNFRHNHKPWYIHSVAATLFRFMLSMYVRWLVFLISVQEICNQ